MSLKITQARVEDDRLTLLLTENEDGELSTVFEGQVTTTMSMGAGYASVNFHCTPHSADKHARGLNSAPVDF